MFEEQLISERRFLDVWLENNFPERAVSDTRSLWSYAGSSRAGEWTARETSHMSSWEAGPSAQDSWQNISKSFQVLTFLCSELQLLEQFAQKKFYPTLYVIGGSLVRGHASPMGDLELQLANLLPTLQDVLDYLGQFDALVGNLLGQACAILLDDTLDSKRRVVATALKCSARGLMVLFCLQTLLSIKILPLFFNYRRMLHTMMSKTKRNEAEVSTLEHVQDHLVRLEESLRMGAFSTFIDMHIKRGYVGKQLQKKVVASTIESYLLEQIEACCSQLDTPNEDFLARSDLLATMLLFVVFCSSGTYPKDRRVIKAVLEIHQKCPLLPMYYNLVVVPARFLSDMLPSSHLSYLHWDHLKQGSVHSTAYLQLLQKSITARLERVSLRGAAWTTELASLLSEGDGIISAADREQFLTMLMEGLHLMKYLRESFESIVQLHVERSQPMKKCTLRCVTSCICYLKLISGQIFRSWEVVEQNLDFFLEHYKMKLLEQLKRAYDYLLQVDKSERTQHVRRVLSRLGASQLPSPESVTICVKLVKLGIQTLQEKATTPQRLLLNFIVHSISTFQFIPDDIESECLACLKQMEVVEMIGALLQKMGCCDLLYFHPELMRNALQQLLQHPDEASKLPHLVNAFLDIRFLAEDSGMGCSISLFENEIAAMLSVYFLKPLGRIVERELLNIVCGKLSSQRNRPEDHVDYQNNVLPLLQLGPLTLINRDLNILDAVKVQLTKALRRLSIHGELRWDVLCRVKNIAQEKYGIVLESPEPSEGSTPSTLDHLNSTESIKAFVASYMFQLHSFTFVLSPRSPSHPRPDLPEVVRLEDFMDLVQADVTQVGPAALVSLKQTLDEEHDLIQERRLSPIHARSNESPGGGITSQSKSDEAPEELGRQQDLPPSEGRTSAVSNHGINPEMMRRSSSFPVPQGSALSSGNAPWSYVMNRHGMYYQESMGSETSLRPAPRSSDEPAREGRVTVLTRLLTDALRDLLKQVTELCGASETRSILSQTTQRWHNSQKAVGNQYPVPQADLVRKEVVALLKAGTLTTNIIHKLRFLIGDIGKVVSMVMLVYHAASSVRQRTFAIIPRDIQVRSASLAEFIEQVASVLTVSNREKICQEVRPFDLTVDGFGPKASVHVQYMQLLEPTFEEALDDAQVEVLRNLFILVPAMSLDHIESMRSLKNQYQGSSLNKVTANTEDSFAVGLSFLLTMLNQMTKFEAFHWFDSARRQYQTRLDRVRATSLSQRGNLVSTSLRRTPDLEAQRSMDQMDSLKGIMSELILLEQSMMCGKVFFQKRGQTRTAMD